MATKEVTVHLRAPTHAQGVEAAGRVLRDHITLAARRSLAQSSRPHVSGAVSSAQDCVTDQCMIVRLVPGVASDALDGTMGLSTGVNAFLGANGAIRAAQRAGIAARVGYTDGERAARVEQAGRLVQATGGTLFFGVRGLTLASYIKNVDTSSATVPTLLGRVTYIASTIGNALWGVFYALLGLLCAVEIYNASKFRAEFEEAADDPTKFEGFLYKWTADPEDSLLEDNATEEQLIAQGREHAINELRKVAKKGGLQWSQKQLEERADALAADKENFYKNLGLDIERVKYHTKRRMQLISMIGLGCTNKLEVLGRQMIEGHNAAEDEDEIATFKIQNTISLAAFRKAAPLIAEIRAHMNTNFWVNVGYLVACMIGILATIAMFVFTGGMAPLLITIAFLVVGTMMIGLDGYCVNKALKNTPPHEFDKTMLAISSAIALIGFAASIAVISVLSLGIVPLIATLVIATLWLGINAATWGKILYNGHKQAVDNAVLVDAVNGNKKMKERFLRWIHRHREQPNPVHALHAIVS